MRRAFTLVLSLLLVYTAVAAQDVRYGVLHPYPDSPGEETSAPVGYKPFYISHFGRHGSRYLSSEKVVQPALTVLIAAQEEGILTPKGKMLLDKVQELYTLSEGMWGQLSTLGAEEHKAIARRMVKRYPAVFSDSIRVMASVYPRCIVSMAASTGEIARLARKSKWSYKIGKRYQSIINTSHRPQSWISGASLQRKYLKEHLDEENLLACLFSDTVRGKELGGNSASFWKAIYYGWAGREAVGLEPFALEDILGVQAVDVIAASDNLAGYRNMAIPNADSLITDIVVKADAAIASGKPQADLRYGHDNGLMRLLVQLGMEGYPVGLDEGKAAAFCFAEKMPLAANLQMVFYRNGKGKVLVKFLINEKETKLTIVPGGPYYTWEDVRALLEKHCLK
ncbi:MAG: hypothetical protein IJP39_08120 [Bacteroidales bacterium]|nr:hypothetical protein [Bacteroidales bacterium]MBQ7709457.1 hypothetical protein [Bacteroidales bacterium]